MPLLRRRNMNTQNNNIEILDYIQNTGTQYIDTEYIPNQKTKVALDIQFENSGKRNNHSGFFGVEDNTGIFEINFIAGISNTLLIWTNSFSNSSAYPDVETITNRNILVLDAVGRFEYGKISKAVKRHTLNTLKYSMILFGWVKNGTVNVLDCHYNMRLYGCKIYEDDVLVKDFVPAKIGEKVGLYDNVSKKFHGNKGTGEFVYSEKLSK